MYDKEGEFIKEIGLDEWHLMAMIDFDSKILFIKPRNLKFIRYLITDRRATISAIDRVAKNVEVYNKLGIELFYGDVYSELPKIKEKSFDLIILDDSLFSFFEVDFVLQNCISASKYVLISFTNFTHYSKRIQFLWSGSFFDFETDEWLNTKQLKFCSYKEFMKLCHNLDITIERGSYHSGERQLISLYDIKKFPGLFAKKFFFTLSSNSSQIGITTMINSSTLSNQA